MASIGRLPTSGMQAVQNPPQSEVQDLGNPPGHVRQSNCISPLRGPMIVCQIVVHWVSPCSKWLHVVRGRQSLPSWWLWYSPCRATEWMLFPAREGRGGNRSHRWTGEASENGQSSVRVDRFCLNRPSVSPLGGFNEPSSVEFDSTLASDLIDGRSLSTGSLAGQARWAAAWWWHWPQLSAQSGLHHRRTGVQPCVNGDTSFQWELLWLSAFFLPTPLGGN